MWIVPLALAVLALVVTAGVPVFGTEAPPDVEVQYVEVADGTLLWPYTSHSKTFRARTLAINVIVYGEPAALQRHLTERARGDWNETRNETEDVHPVVGEENGTLTAWASAEGATRYTHINRPREGTTVWLTESYQLHDGDYFGARHHLRVYESPSEDEDWVAIQAHHEHWDWFRLRHTVDGVRAAQGHVEQEFMAQPFVGDISRVYVDSARGADMDGWVTVVRLGGRDQTVLTAAVLAVGIPALRRLRGAATESVTAISKRNQRIGLLATVVSLVYLTVRFGAIGIERYVPFLDPPSTAILLYPVLVVGLPVCAYLFARRLDQEAGFLAAAAGFIAAILLDYTYLQVTVLPIDTIVHRLTLAVALGLVAMGASQSVWQPEGPNSYLRMGVLLWISAVGLPLMRFV